MANARSRILPLILVTTVLLIGGCGRPAGVIFPPLDDPPRWPAAPESARIVYVGALERSSDLAPAKSFGSGLSETLFGQEPEQTMLTPQAVCTDRISQSDGESGAGRVFVADSTAQTVHVFDLESRDYSQWRPPKDAPPLAQPIAIAFDPAGRLLVSDSIGAAVHIFDSTGTWLGLLNVPGLQRPCGIAVDAERERLYVTDIAAHQVFVLSLDGALIETIGGRGAGLGQFNFPTYLACDDEGRLYVSDTLNFRVQAFGPDYQPLRAIGQHGDVPGSFSQPKGIALDRENHLYVVDAHFEAVQVFDPQGRLLLVVGAEGTGHGEFWLPAGIHVDGQNRIWVADSYNRRIQVFQYLSELTP